MLSKLECSLLRCRQTEDKFRSTLFNYLDDGVSLRKLRRSSRVLRDLIDKQPGRLFREIYIRAPLSTYDDTKSLAIVAPFCYSLTISIGFGGAVSEAMTRSDRSSNEAKHRSRDFRRLIRQRSLLSGGNRRRSTLSLAQSLESMSPSGVDARASIPPAQLPSTERQQLNHSRQRWATLLSCFHQLCMLKLRVKGDPAWPGRTEVEDMLVTLRMAIETANLKKLRTFSLVPIHAMGIIHLRWLGIGTFGQAQASSAAVWMSIDTLDLRIHNPFASGNLTEVQQVMFRKILYEYLRSFAYSLKCLRLVWLGSEGPSPLALHNEPGLEGRSPIKWPKLEDLWIGNVKAPNRSISLARELARGDTCVKVLRSTHRDCLMDVSDSTAWIEVLGSTAVSSRVGMLDGTSSIYSQSALSDQTIWEGGISRSSREIPIMLDL